MKKNALEKAFPLNKMLFTQKVIVATLAQLFLCGASYALAPFNAVKDLGILTNLQTVENKEENYYKFQIPYATSVSIFLNGLSAGYQIELQDGQGTLLASASNQGTKWNTPLDSGKTGGAIVSELKPGYYFVHVSRGDTLPGDVYGNKEDSYTLNLIPDNAPKTIVIAASNSLGNTDNEKINQAIQGAANMGGGGRVLLRPGIYNIKNNIQVTYDNITLMGTGWSTVLKLVDNAKLEGAGLIRSRFIDNSKNKLKDHFSNQHFMHFSMDGNRAGKPFFLTSVGNYGTYVDSTFEDIRAHDFPRYGLDPHEGVQLTSNTTTPTSNITIKDSLIDHNGRDGLVFQKTINSTVKNNIFDGNVRHGINLVAESSLNAIQNNIVTHNGGNGIAIQPGSDLKRNSNANVISDNMIKFNDRNGVYIYRAQNTMIKNNIVSENGWYGIHFRAASNNTAQRNTLDDNSCNNDDEYAGINFSGDRSTYSTQNKILKNFLHMANNTASKFGIVENEAMDDFNQVIGNVLQYFKKPIRLKGPNSVAKDNEV